MLPAVLPAVRYWGWFAAKVTAGELCVASLLWLVNRNYRPRTPFFHVNLHHFGYDLPYTSMAGVCFLLGYLVVYFAIRDQQYRCRMCLRRMRMPVFRGSWSMMLQFGRPKMEYICPYGHGKLGVAELQIAGRENPEWTAHGEIWDELFADSSAGKHDER
jgi:hypothetical protein